MTNRTEPARAIHAWIDGRKVRVELEDGREIAFPADRFRRLAIASDDQLRQVKIEARGRALRWEELDEDLWIEGILAGRWLPGVTVSFVEIECGHMSVDSQIRCDKCQSSDVMLVADPKTGLPYKVLEHFGAVCRGCGHRFAVSEVEGVALLASHASDVALQGDHPCPKCEYNLRGHRVGDRCPECGTVIVSDRLAPANAFRKPRKPTSLWNWLAIVWVIALIVAYYSESKMSKTIWAELTMFIVAIGLIGNGMKGIVTGQITPYRAASFEGKSAKTAGIVSIIVGLGVITLAVLLRLGIVK